MAPTAQPARMASAPALRVRPPVAEPPPWLDAPDADEAGAAAPMRVDVDDAADADFAAPGSADDDRDVPVPPPQSAPLQWTEPGERWAALVRGMVEAGRITAMARELAMQAQCLLLDEVARPVVCRLRVDREMLRAPALVEKLQAAVGAMLGCEAKVETDAGAVADSPARRDAAERDRRQRDAEDIIRNDPLVRALMSQYATARIVPGSVKPH